LNNFHSTSSLLSPFFFTVHPLLKDYFVFTSVHNADHPRMITLNRPHPSSPVNVPYPLQSSQNADQQGRLARDFFLQVALPGEIDALNAMEQARNGYNVAEGRKAFELWKLYRSLVNSLLRVGVNSNDKQGFPIINRVIAVGADPLTRHLTQLGFPLSFREKLEQYQNRFFRALRLNNEAGAELAREAYKVPGFNINRVLSDLIDSRYLDENIRPKFIQDISEVPGFNVNTESASNTGQHSLLAVAAMKGWTHSVRTLLSIPGIQVDQPDFNGQTPLHLVIAQARMDDAVRADLAQALLTAGADPNKADKGGNTPLSLALSRNRSNSQVLVELLAQAGADLSKVDGYGATPLQVAAIHNHPQAVEALLQHGADINPRDREGYSPLWRAIYAGSEEAAEVLLARGADANQVDDRGNGLLHMVIHNDHMDAQERVALIQLLCRRGANPNLRNGQGRTPLQLLKESNLDRASRKALKQVLVSHGAKRPSWLSRHLPF
jgi:ankyrin repeat protein